MCGIAGLVLHGNETPNKEQLQLMGESMHYSGPDDEGFFPIRILV